MTRGDVGDLSLSFVKLQRLARGFDEASSSTGSRRQASRASKKGSPAGSAGKGSPAGSAGSVAGSPAEHQTLCRLAGQLGATAIPLCIRELGSTVDARVRLAYTLLGHLGARADTRPRIIAALEALVQRAGTGDHVKLRGLALLSDLGCEPPAGTRLDDASAARERSLRELARYLSTWSDIARAGDMLITRLAADDLIALVDALGLKEPRRAIPLIDELLLRNDVDERVRSELKRIRAPLRDRYGERHLPAPGSDAVATSAVGRHANGRWVVVASRRVPGTRPSQHRALCVLIGADGVMTDGLYRDDFTADGVDREVVRPLRSQGYRFEPMRALDAADLVIRAAQAARHLGKPLPRGFYLGRDLLGIYDQHAVGASFDDDLATLLERGRELLAAGELARARPILERYVAQMPECADGCAGLAMCLIALGDLTGARPHLRRAAWLEPSNPNHHWNLAAIAHREARPGACYLALIDYLHNAGEFDEAPGDSRERRRTAETFLAEYERIARLEYPEVEPDAVAHADDLVYRAVQRLEAGQTDEAIVVLEQALSFVPSCYPALAYMGIALAERGEVTEAARHLHRALAVRPGYPLAAQALERLERPAVLPPRRARPRRHASNKAASIEETRGL